MGSQPYIIVNTYSDSPTGHTNVTFYDGNGQWAGTYGANLGTTSMPGDFGGVYAENPGRSASYQSIVNVNQSQWDNALGFAKHEAFMTSRGAGEYVPLGKNCYDFVDDVLVKAGQADNTAWTHMASGSLVQIYGRVQYDLTYGFDSLFNKASNDESFGTGFYQDIQVWNNFRYDTRGGWHSYDPDVGWEVGAKIEKLTTETWVSPIAIDMNGDGFEISNLSESVATFDYYGKGEQIRTAWLTGSDAFLVRDLNGDGKISDLSEMFGGLVVGDGFAKLRTLDSNNDGILSAKDKEWGDLQLWFDRNANGITEKGELQNISESKIESITLGSDKISVRLGDGFITDKSSAISSAGIVEVADIYFKVGGVLPHLETDALNGSGIETAIGSPDYNILQNSVGDIDHQFGFGMHYNPYDYMIA